MPLIQDPDLLADSAIDDSSTEVFIDTTALTIKLNPGVGDLIAADGATIKVIWSFLKEQWHGDPLTKNLASFPFPMENITDEFFELIEGWSWADAPTRQSIRNGGWVIRNSAGNVTEHWAGTKAIGNIFGTDQLYYTFDGSTPVNYTFTGAINEAVQIIDDPNGDGNYVDGFDNSGSFSMFNREQAQLFAKGDLASIGEPSLLAPKVFSFAVGTGADLDVVETDVNIAANAPYTGMSITWHATPQQRDIGGTNRDFGIIIEGNGGTKQQIYEYVQFQLRQVTDIDADADTKIGKLQDALLQFTGTNLSTLQGTNPDGGGTGVYVDNFDVTEINDWTFIDNTATARMFPFLAGFTIDGNATAFADGTFKYFAYMTDPDGAPDGDEWGTAGGIILEDNTPTPITGLMGGSAKVFSIDYDGSTQGGRTPGTDIPVTVVGIGITEQGAKYVRATGTIARQANNVVTLVAGQDRQYQNP